MECGSCHEKYNVVFICESAIEHYAFCFVHVRVPLAWTSWVLGGTNAWSGEWQYSLVVDNGAQFTFLGRLHYANYIASHKEVCQVNQSVQ